MLGLHVVVALHTDESPVQNVPSLVPVHDGLQASEEMPSLPPIEAQQTWPGQLAGPEHETSALLVHPPGAPHVSPFGEKPS